ncbi:winged helix DNA-binding protein [Sphingosinicella sp.]|uniref:winged helix DNA-binding protein n=1 Tax=Sphingosinicella sp. TaxID=1917971 RepID=UPI0026263E82|nr:winged helix DNA-binding protein [Sphingosinicella sp.]
MAETFSVAGPARIQLALPQALETALRTTLDAAGIGHARIDTAALFAEPPAPLAKLPLVVAARDGLVAGTERPLAEAGILSKTAPVIVILDDDALDGAISIMDIEGVELAAWPLGAEDILSILERIDIGQGYAAGVREKGPDAFVQIGMLSDEVSRIADQLARLASMKDGPVLPAAVTDRSAAETARSIREIRKRQARKQFFPAELFADPAWDIMLDLAAARLEGKQVSVSSLCIAADVPTTTALRWIKGMTDAGMLARRSDPEDGRRSFIDLSDKAAEAMDRYIALVDSGAI